LLRLAFARAPLDEILSGVVVISTHPCSLIDIDAHQCRWPIGDPGSPEFYFCGGDTTNELPYCAYHCRVAYQPATDRRRDRRAMRG